MLTKTGVPEGVAVRTVSELTQQVKGLLEQEFLTVWVEGEVSNLARPNSGHVYFSLKDPEAALRAVMYRGIALRQRFDLKDGMEVFARGRLSVYAPRGDYQLLIEELHPKGLGALELALRQLKEKLLKLGYFDPKRKKRWPRYPKTVALVTSATGAAVRDMLEILGRRWPAAAVVVRPVRVQGEGAAEEISAAVTLLNQLHQRGDLSVDVIIVGRGGGSVEDLWPFNQEVVAQAIFRSRVPVVSAVGHEIDVTVADLVADARAATPTDAAQLVTPDRQELLAGVVDAGRRLDAAVWQRLRDARKELDAMAARRALRLPLERVRDQERRLDEIGERLTRAARTRVRSAGDRVAALAGRLGTLSPLNVLARGYSLTHTEAGPELVRDAASVRPGDRLRTTVANGEILSRVEEVRPAGRDT